MIVDKIIFEIFLLLSIFSSRIIQSCKSFHSCYKETTLLSQNLTSRSAFQSWKIPTTAYTFVFSKQIISIIVKTHFEIDFFNKMIFQLNNDRFLYSITFLLKMRFLIFAIIKFQMKNVELLINFFSKKNWTINL